MREGGAPAGLGHPAEADTNEDTNTITRKKRNGKDITFGALGPKLFAKGFPIIPLNGKVPIPSAWNKRPPTEAEVDRWTVAHPSANIGMLCGFGDIVGLDLDIYDAEIAESVQTLFGYLYDCPVRIGQAPKRLLLARCPGLDHKLISAAYDHAAAPSAKGEKRNISRIEVLGPGQQFAVAGTHPDTDQPYMGLDYDQLTLDSLPVICMDDLFDLLEVFETKAEKAGWRRVADRPAGSRRPGMDVVGPGEKHGGTGTTPALPTRQGKGEAKTSVDAYNLGGRDHFVEALLEDGWSRHSGGEFAFTDPDTGAQHIVDALRLTRPGKNVADGPSASLYQHPGTGQWRFTLFSSSIEEIEPGDYLISHAYTHLIREGDYGAAISALREAEFRGSDDRSAEADFTRFAAQIEAGLRPLDIGLALTSVPPRREFVIEKYIPKGIIAAMAGTGGQGKSYMALVMAVAVAAGRSIPPFQVSGPGVVLFVSVEDDGQDLAARLHWIGREYQLTAEEQALLERNLIIYPARGHVGPLMQLGHHGNPEPAAGSVWLRDRLAQYEPVLTLLDTKSRLFGLEENSNDHGARWVSNLESMLVDHPSSSFLVITHVGKGAVGSSDQHAARGATSFIDNSRSVLVLTAADDKEVKALRAEGAGPVHKLVHAKQSYSAPAPVVFFSKNPMGVPVHLPALEGDRLRDQALTMLVRAMQVSYPAGVNRRNLERGLGDAAMLKELVCDEMGLDRAMWSATIQRGVDKGVLELFRDESASAKNKPLVLRVVHESGCESESTHHA